MTDEPVAGHYKTHWWRAKLVKGGPWVGVRTFMAGPLIDGETLDRSPRWQAQVRNETTGRAILFGEPCPIEIEGMGLRNIEPIEESDYRYLVDHAAYATQHAPHLPDASPTTKVDFMKLVPF